MSALPIRLRRETKVLLLAVAVGSIGLNAALPALPGQPRGVMTSLDYSSAWLRRIAHEDSWKPMRIGRDWLAAQRAGQWPGETLYQAVFFEKGVKLQYPPTSLLPLEALGAISDAWTSNAVLNGLSWAAVLLAALLSAAVLERGIRGPPDRIDRSVRVLLALVAGLAFYPLTRGFYLGQVQTWIDALVAGILLAWVCGRPATSGALTALVCLIKPQLGLLFLWALLRGHRRFAIAFACVGLAFGAVSLALYGLHNHLDYLEALSYIGRHGESFHPNQSVNGLVHRMLGNGNNLPWSKGFPPFDVRVYIATLVSSAVLLGGALFWRRQDARNAPALDLAVVITSATVASPVAWTHHYAVLLPLFALALPPCVAASARRGLAFFALGLSFLLVGNTYRIANRLAETPLNFAQSYVLFGGLAFLALLYWLRAIAPANERSPEP